MNKTCGVLCKNFISIYKIKKILHAGLGIRIFSSRVESIYHSFPKVAAIFHKQTRNFPKKTTNCKKRLLFSKKINSDICKRNCHFWKINSDVPVKKPLFLKNELQFSKNKLLIINLHWCFLPFFVPNLGVVGSNAIFRSGNHIIGPEAPISPRPEDDEF